MCQSPSQPPRWALGQTDGQPAGGADRDSRAPIAPRAEGPVDCKVRFITARTQPGRRAPLEASPTALGQKQPLCSCDVQIPPWGLRRHNRSLLIGDFYRCKAQDSLGESEDYWGPSRTETCSWANFDTILKTDSWSPYTLSPSPQRPSSKVLGVKNLCQPLSSPDL